MYRQAFAAIEASPLRSRYTLLADAQELIDEYKLITSLEIGLAPIPHVRRAGCEIINHARHNKAIVTYVGEARYNKGFHLLPRLINGFCHRGLNAHFNVQSYIHNSSDKFYRRAMAKIDHSHVTLFSHQMDDQEYQAYLEAADIILVPYLLENYHRQTSGIYAEAAAMGKPTIVPRGTWMARQVKQYGGGRVFVPNDGESLLEVTAEAVELRIPLKSAADSERSRPPVPIEAGRGFR
jgi:glycosyltransferase involved in cell wall biosynthesis